MKQPLGESVLSQLSYTPMSKGYQNTLRHVSIDVFVCVRSATGVDTGTNRQLYNKLWYDTYRLRQISGARKP